jgi:signal transduction histidine kinase
MPHLAIVARNPALVSHNAAQFAHDIRNAAATIGLHVETLQRLAGPCGAKAAGAAEALLSKVASFCNSALQTAANSDALPRRTVFDVTSTVRQVTNLLAPLMPEGSEMWFDAQQKPLLALANQQDVFRVIYNIAHNGVVVARRTRRLNAIVFTLESDAGEIRLCVTDDGPGLPQKVKSKLFCHARGRAGDDHSGHGLQIARELAERNGGTLELENTSLGTSFTLILAALTDVTDADKFGIRSLG